MMRIKNKTGSCLKFLFLAILVAFLGFTGVFKQSTNAQGSSGYEVSPVRQELTIEKGQSKTVTLNIKNLTQSTKTTRAIVNDFEAGDEENGQPRFVSDDSSTGGNSFKTLVSDIPDITLEPQQKLQVDIVISVPADAYAGGYYGAIRFVDASVENDQNVTMSASTGTIFLVEVPGDLTESMELVEFTPAQDGSNSRFFVGEGDNISIVTRLRNTGNIHVKPFGKVTITDSDGNTVETFEFNNIEPRANVLPDSIRRFEDKLQNQKWFGKYTVTANLGYGTTGSLITASTYFWVVPLWLLIAIVAGIIAILVGGYFAYRKIANNRRMRNRIRMR